MIAYGYCMIEMKSNNKEFLSCTSSALYPDLLTTPLYSSRRAGLGSRQNV